MRYIAAFIIIMVSLSLPAFGEVRAIAVDPTAYTPSARVLGMGRAYVGLADDAAAIYLNPAGIAQTKAWKMTSMSGQFLEAYDYLSVTGIYPTNFGVFGVGYDNFSISGAPSTTIDATSDPSDPIYIVDPNQPPMSNYNSVLMLSYGAEMKNLLPQLGFLDKVDFGASLRLYSVGLAGDAITQGSGSGSELDLGLMYRPDPRFSIGASALNILPADMGGKLTYQTGHEESYPATIKLGTAVNVVGEKDSLIKLGNQRVTALLDFDYMPTIKNYPILYHFGVEYAPVEMMAVRAGFDASAMGDGNNGFETFADLTLGVGFRYGGFSFDYAYHQFAVVPGIDNHTFSFSYAPAPPAKPAEAAKVEKIILIEEPKDKTLTFSEQVTVSGKLATLQGVQELALNGEPLPVRTGGVFSAAAPLAEGKNKLVVSALGRLRLTLEEETVRLLRIAKFPDVPEGHWAREQVGLISMLGIVQGYPDGTFKPEGNITRAELAALLMRTKARDGGASPYMQPRSFKDVRPAHWAYRFISDAASSGVVLGYPDGTFKPGGNVTRAEGLTMIARFAGVQQEPYVYQLFPDIRPAHWAAPIIAGSYKEGLLQFLQGQSFQPSRNLNRAEAVEMLSKTKFVIGLLEKDLLDWEGY